MKSATILIAVVMCMGVMADAEAAKKKSSSGTPTAEQRKKMYEAGLKGCRKKYGSQLHFVRIEKFYGRWAPVCYHY